jgi:hypothetical protein
VTIENQLSSPTLVNTQQHFYADGDDGDDKKLLFTKADLEKSKNTAILKVGDRVRYIGQQKMYKGSLGKVVEVDGDFAKRTLHDRYVCDFSGNLTKQLTREELEAIA